MGQSNSPAVLAEKDWPAIEHCLGIIRQCQMNDGMIRAKGDLELVWTVPYSANFGAMALLAANQCHPNAQDVHRVESWLLWYAANQESDGTIFDREGTLSFYRSKGKRDSTDSYAAGFLMTVWRYRQAIGKTPSLEIVHSAIKALGAIESVTQSDGLTITKPEYPIKYLMDNIEVYGGLIEGAKFFDAVGCLREAATARKRAGRIAEGLKKFWSQKNQAYWVALDMAGNFSGDRLKSYPHGLAQLFALAHLDPGRKALWQDLRKDFSCDSEGMPVERWLMAATRCATPDQVHLLRQAAREAMLQFTSRSVYVDRPALAVLALVDKEARFPDVVYRDDVK